MGSAGDRGVSDESDAPTTGAGDPVGLPRTSRESDAPSPERSALLGPKEVRELAERLGVSPTKKLGQNFVIDPNTVRKIVRLAGVQADDRVIEVGPGLGSLTLGITEAGGDVTAVEIDHRLAAELLNTARAMQPEIFAEDLAPRLRVVRSDALQVTAEQLGDPAPEILVANLPYNVSVPILMHLLELVPALRVGLVMVQAEVGHRIAAGPGSKEYGSPSAKAAWYGDWRIAGTVSRRIFWPVPGVDSVLVSYARRAHPLGSEAERLLTFELVNAAFAQRRKMLRQALQSVLGPLETTVATLEAAGIAPTDRAEQLSISDYLVIARAHGGDPSKPVPPVR